MNNPIYFDARYIRVGHHDGISRFSAGLFEALARKTKVVAIISDLAQLEKLPQGTDYVKLNDPTNAIAELFIALKLNALGAKIVFSPMQTMGTFLRKYKVVLTLHDLIYYAHPTPPPSFNRIIRLGWRLFHLTYLPQRFILNQADAIATVSNTTKRLIQKHHLTKKPVFVVYNASSGQAVQRKTKPNKSLIYMGSYMDYKNVACLIQAMQFLPEYELHLLSRISENRKAELQSLAEASSARVIFHNGVSDEEYQSLLGHAFALVSASRDEGFGIPVIEAMQQGTPAIISDIEIFREIGGTAASYFNPDRAEQLAECVRQLENTDTWSAVSVASLAQAANFNWDRSADTLLNELKNIG